MKKLWICLLTCLTFLVGCGGDAASSIKPPLIDIVNPEIRMTGDEYPYFQSLRALGVYDIYLKYLNNTNIYEKTQMAEATKNNILNDVWKSALFDYQVAGYAYFYYRDVRTKGFNFKQPGITEQSIIADWKNSFMSLVPIHNKLYAASNGSISKLENEGIIELDEKSLSDAFDRHRGLIFNHQSIIDNGNSVRGGLYGLFYRKQSKRTRYAATNVRDLYEYYSLDGLDYIMSRLYYDISKLIHTVDNGSSSDVTIAEYKMKKIAQFNFEEYYKTKKL